MKHTKRFSIGCLIAWLVVFSISAEQVRDDDGSWLKNYDGMIGDKYRIRLTLTICSNRVDGVYFYATQLKDITIRGKVIEATRVIVLDELDSRGKVTARFEGEFRQQDPRFGSSKLDKEVIAGVWHKVDSNSKQPFQLSMESASFGTLTNRYEVAGARDTELIHRQAKLFWDAVKAGDKKKTAELVAYPIEIRLSKRVLQIKNSKELIANYDLIFTPAYVKNISKALPRNMFVNSQGIMLGNGEVWFGGDGKVMGLNVTQD